MGDDEINRYGCGVSHRIEMAEQCIGREMEGEDVAEY